ncbi:hypothetical protein [Thiogranum longum]|jgi:hypothetical protein
MDYQEYLRHLSVTMPGTMPMARDEWERAQLGRYAEAAITLITRYQYSIPRALQSLMINGEMREAVHDEIMRRFDNG